MIKNKGGRYNMTQAEIADYRKKFVKQLPVKFTSVDIARVLNVHKSQVTRMRRGV